MEKVKICLNSELANNLGNLLSRCTSKKLNPDQSFPRFELAETLKICAEASDVVEYSETLASNVFESYRDGNFYIGITQVMDFIRLVNSLINATEPWRLTSSAEHQHRLSVIIYVALEAIRVSAIMLQPIIPRMSSNILDVLNVAAEARTWQHAQVPFSSARDHSTSLVKHKAILYPKLV